jgi:arylformamidase
MGPFFAQSFLRTGRRAVQAILLLGMLWHGMAAQATSGPRALPDERDEAALVEALLDEDDSDTAPEAVLPLPVAKQVRVLRDQAYGSDERQRMDVYLPLKSQGAPVVFMVHGGAWRTGDKAAAVVQRKVERWVPDGAVLVSVNYRLLPEAGPLQQVADVAQALAHAQRQAKAWGADARRFVVMGHSAGGHLVALLAASPERLQALGAQPVRANIVLDSAALDVPRIMQQRHLRLYDAAFGRNPAQWEAASPLHQLHQLRQAGAPLLVVCSSRRNQACEQARNFVLRAQALGMRAEVLTQALSHHDINAQLGQPGEYTEAVEAFLRSTGVSLP